MEKARRRFNVRAFVDMMIVLCFAGLPVTGIANHLLGFRDMNIERHAWMSAHNVLGLLFVVFVIWHIILNRRPLWSFVRGAAGRFSGVSREAILASTIVIAILLLFVGHAFHAAH